MLFSEFSLTVTECRIKPDVGFRPNPAKDDRANLVGENLSQNIELKYHIFFTDDKQLINLICLFD